MFRCEPVAIALIEHGERSFLAKPERLNLLAAANLKHAGSTKHHDASLLVILGHVVRVPIDIPESEDCRIV